MTRYTLWAHSHCVAVFIYKGIRNETFYLNIFLLMVIFGFFGIHFCGRICSTCVNVPLTRFIWSSFLRLSHILKTKQAVSSLHPYLWVYSKHPSAFAWTKMHAFCKSNCDCVCFCVAESRHTDPRVEGEARLQQWDGQDNCSWVSCPTFYSLVPEPHQLWPRLARHLQGWPSEFQWCVCVFVCKREEERWRN